MHYVLVNQSADKSMRISFHHAHSLDDVVHLSMIRSTFAELEAEVLMDIDIVDMLEEVSSEVGMHDETSIVQSSTSHLHDHLVHNYAESSDKVDASSSVVLN